MSDERLVHVSSLEDPFHEGTHAITFSRDKLGMHRSEMYYGVFTAISTPRAKHYSLVLSYHLLMLMLHMLMSEFVCSCWNLICSCRLLASSCQLVINSSQPIIRSAKTRDIAAF